MNTASIFAFTLSELRDYFERTPAEAIPDGFVYGMTGWVFSVPVFHIRRTRDPIQDGVAFYLRTNATPVFGFPKHSWLCDRLDVQVTDTVEMGIQFCHSPRNNWNYVALPQGVVAELPRGGRELTAAEVDEIPNSVAQHIQVYQEIDFNDLDLRIVDPPDKKTRRERGA